MMRAEVVPVAVPPHQKMLALVAPFVALGPKCVGPKMVNILIKRYGYVVGGYVFLFYIRYLLTLPSLAQPHVGNYSYSVLVPAFGMARDFIAMAMNRVEDLSVSSDDVVFKQAAVLRATAYKDVNVAFPEHPAPQRARGLRGEDARWENSGRMDELILRAYAAMANGALCDMTPAKFVYSLVTARAAMPALYAQLTKSEMTSRLRREDFFVGTPGGKRIPRAQLPLL